MKRMLMAIMAVAVAVTFSAPAFAGEEGKKKEEKKAGHVVVFGEEGKKKEEKKGGHADEGKKKDEKEKKGH